MNAHEAAKWVIGNGWVDEATIRALWSELGPNPDLLRALHRRGLLPPHAYAHLRNSLTSWSGLPRPTPSLDTTPQSFDLGALVASRYRLDHLLGKGAMGAVFRAHDLEQNRPVALKVLLSLEPRLQARFEREALAVAQVDHQGGVVRVWSAGTHAGRPFLAMELIEGDDLEASLDRGLEPRRLAEILERVAQTLEACHAKGIVHRDLKPANILVDAETGEPRVADFGLATVAEGQRLTRTGDLLGTLAYMAPEQGLSAGSVDARADVYALGAILFHGLTGQAPMLDPGAPSDSTEGVDPELEAVCLKAMRRDPADRYQSAGELSEELGRYLRGEGVRARRLGWWGRVREGWRRRERSVVVGGALVAGLGIAGVAGAGYWVGVVRPEAEAKRTLAEAKEWVEAVKDELVRGETGPGPEEVAEWSRRLEGVRGVGAEDEDLASSLARWVEALGGGGTTAEACWVQAAAASRAGSFEQALSVIERGLRRDGASLYGRRLRGWVLLRAAEADGSFAPEFFRALGQGPSDDVLRARASVALAAWCGRLSQAVLQAERPEAAQLERTEAALRGLRAASDAAGLAWAEVAEAARVTKQAAIDEAAEEWGGRAAAIAGSAPDRARRWVESVGVLVRAAPEVAPSARLRAALDQVAAAALAGADLHDDRDVGAVLQLDASILYRVDADHLAPDGLDRALYRLIPRHDDDVDWVVAFLRCCAQDARFDAEILARLLSKQALDDAIERAPDAQAARFLRGVQALEFGARPQRLIQQREWVQAIRADLQRAWEAPIQDLSVYNRGRLAYRLMESLNQRLNTFGPNDPQREQNIRAAHEDYLALRDTFLELELRPYKQGEVLLDHWAALLSELDGPRAGLAQVEFAIDHMQGQLERADDPVLEREYHLQLFECWGSAAHFAALARDFDLAWEFNERALSYGDRFRDQSEFSRTWLRALQLASARQGPDAAEAVIERAPSDLSAESVDWARLTVTVALDRGDLDRARSRLERAEAHYGPKLLASSRAALDDALPR